MEAAASRQRQRAACKTWEAEPAWAVWAEVNMWPYGQLNMGSVKGVFDKGGKWKRENRKD